MSGVTCSRAARALLVLVPLALACSGGPAAPAQSTARPPRVAASFVATVDAAAGVVTIEPVAEDLSGAGAGALTADVGELVVEQDGVPYSGSPDTVELRTISSRVVPDGCGAGVDAFEAEVELNSFFAAHLLANPFVEILRLAPSGRESCAGAAPITPATSAELGLFAYGDVPPSGSARATWTFRLPDVTRFTFTGRVVAELVEAVPPITAPSLPGGDYAGWPLPLEVWLFCDDAGGSGCARTSFSLGGGPERPWDGQPILVFDETDLCFRSADASGNLEERGCEHYVVSPPAAEPDGRGVPTCLAPAARCDSGTLLVGRGALGPEPAPPSNLWLCADGAEGAFHVDASLDRLVVSVPGGGPLAAGAPALVEATVWASENPKDEALDVWYSEQAEAGGWRLVATLVPDAPGAQVLSTAIALDERGDLHGVRGVLRRAGAPGYPCGEGPYDDTDDLLFRAAPAERYPSVAVTAPRDGLVARGPVRLAAEAWAAIGVDRVSFVLEGPTTEWLGPVLAPPYEVMWDPSAAAPGLYRVRAVAVDHLGRETWSEWTSAPTIEVVDRSAPEVWVSAPPFVTGGAAVEVYASDAPGGVASLELRVDGLVVATAEGPSLAYAWEAGRFAEGPHVLVARARDPLGNAGTSLPIETVADYTPPALSLDAPTDGASVGPLLAASVSASDANGVAWVRFTVDEAAVGTSFWAPYALSVSTEPWAAGPHLVGASAADLAGNETVAPPVTVDVLADATPPAVALTSYPGSASPDVRPGASLYLVATASDDFHRVTRVEFLVDGAVAATDAAGPSWTASLAAPTAPGAHVVAARAYDVAGNSATSTVALVVDASAPTLSLVSPQEGAALSGDVVLEATASDDRAVARVEFWGPNGRLGLVTAPPYRLTWDSGELSNGWGFVQAWAYDRAGNLSAPGTANFTVSNAWTADFGLDLDGLACIEYGDRCGSGDALLGRGTSEWGLPYGTLGDACPDGAGASTYLDAPQVASIRVSSATGERMDEGTEVRVDLRAVTWEPGDAVDLHYAPDARAPAWRHVTSWTPDAHQGAAAYSATFTLDPAGGRHAVRATARRGGSAAACTTGAWDDHDDLAFEVAELDPPTTAVTWPRNGDVVSKAIEVRASSSDDTWVARQEIYVDGALVGDWLSAWWNTGWWTNGPHVLTSRAWDRAGNVAESAPVTVTVSNVPIALPVQLVANGGFEAGASGWTDTYGAITSGGAWPAHGGAWKALFCPPGSCSEISQQLELPTNATRVTLRFWLRVVTSQPPTASPWADQLGVTLRDPVGRLVGYGAVYGNGDASADYVERIVDLTEYAGRTVQLGFEPLRDDFVYPTTFLVDDVRLDAERP